MELNKKRLSDIPIYRLGNMAVFIAIAAAIYSLHTLLFVMGVIFVLMIWIPMTDKTIEG